MEGKWRQRLYSNGIKKIKKVLTDSPKSAILKLPKERKTTAESATVNLLGFQEKKELE